MATSPVTVQLSQLSTSKDQKRPVKALILGGGGSTPPCLNVPGSQASVEVEAQAVSPTDSTLAPCSDSTPLESQSGANEANEANGSGSDGMKPPSGPQRNQIFRGF